jgi:cobalt-zinc-cadmium efflux system outer membrane protein
VPTYGCEVEMRKNLSRIVGLALAGLFLTLRAGVAQKITAPPLTLEEAVVAASRQSPVLRARRAEAEAARGRLTTAGTYSFNPEIEAEGAGRSGSGASTDRGVAVSQEIEIAGQRGRRVTVAQADLAAAEARYRHEEQLVVGRVALAFAEAVRARELLRIEEADASLAQDLLRFEERRLEAGAATQIDLNLARAAAGRSGRRVELAKGAYAEARIALAELIGTGATTPAEPVGDLRVDPGELPALEILVSSALANREDLLAFRGEEEAAQAQVALERSLARPNLVARVFQRREGSEDITGAGLGVGIPLFNRNRGGIAAARAAVDRAAAETAVARLAVEREVASALAVYRAAGAAAEGLRGQVIGNLEENLRLLQRSFEEGKIGRGDLFLFRREFVDSQREYLDVVNQAWQARIRLDLATGRLQIGQPLNRSSQ